MSTTILSCPICQAEISRNGMGTKCPKCAYELQTNKTESIPPHELDEKIKRNEKIVLLDVRQQSEYEFVHLKNALHISIATLPSRIKELNKKDEIIVYCHRGMRSHHAALFLQQRGYNAKALEGGIDKWALIIDEAIPRY